jgi:tripeptidyl-peptidase I
MIFGLYMSNFCISCPYVTTVGGTAQTNPEVAVSFSGGGFSRLFPTPAYQANAVSKYLEILGTKYEGLYKYAIPLEHHMPYRPPDITFSSPAGRAYPDVSAQSDNFEVVIHGNISLVSGTSASSPVSFLVSSHIVMNLRPKKHRLLPQFSLC